MARIKEAEAERMTASVVRCIREKPGLTAEQIAGRLGWQSEFAYAARAVRECVRLARDGGEPITLGERGFGYVHLDSIQDERQRALRVRLHRERTRSYLIGNARLMKALSRMTAVEVGQMMLFDLLIPDDGEAGGQARPVCMKDLAKLPPTRRQSVVRLVRNFLDALKDDPEAWEAERAALADAYGPVFITHEQAEQFEAAYHNIARALGKERP